MERINNYSLDKPLTSNNSGFSKWGIGRRNERPYFIKEFLSPVYPADDAVFSEGKKKERLRLCQAFENGKKRMYVAMREINDGHIVTIEQFFRIGAKYYMSTKAITEHQLSVEEISRSSFIDRLRLCCAVSHAMAGVHSKEIVHADIKPDNILVTRNKDGALIPNIIDFDCSFFEAERPALGEELNGDMVYLSPEGYMHIVGIESKISCKMDVFALGLLFCQYFTGELPGFDRSEYQYPYEAVLDDQPVCLEKIEDAQCREVIGRMIGKLPEDRPDMQSVFKELRSILFRALGRSIPEPAVDAETQEDLYLEPAGDL